MPLSRRRGVHRGFTDCLLQRGARQVFAVDVGHGQLDWGLRNDARVSVLERLDVRALEPSVVPPCDVVTADLSFISLRSVLGDLANIGTSDAEFVLLVKPQFEAGRAKVGKGGIVRDPAVHAEVLDAVCAACAEAGLVPVAVCRSPLAGADGNVEFLLHCRRTGEPVSASMLREVADIPREGMNHGG
ncbi:MAG: hypothetical protein M5U31_12105 [Acidimicrobiia bacterium]|nr:hypothetical protein [Acidimicrobiia bacterium]